jgi:hypothetical protein
MDTTLTVAIITGELGVISGAVVAYVGAIVKYRHELEAEFDKELRKERIRTYPELWRHLELLARYDRPAPLDASHLQELSVAMRKWYFECGGIFLSARTRKSYFDLKGLLRRTMNAPRQEATSGPVDPDAPELVAAASLLRSHLTGDLGGRRSPPIADSE